MSGSSAAGTVRTGFTTLIATSRKGNPALDLACSCESRNPVGCPKRQRLDGHCRLPAPGCHEAAAIAQKQIPHVMRTVIAIDDRGPRIVPHAACAQQVHREILRPDLGTPHL